MIPIRASPPVFLLFSGCQSIFSFPMASAGIPPPVRVLGDSNLPDVDRLMEQNVSLSGVHGDEVPRHSTLNSIHSKPNRKGENSKLDNALLAREALKTAQPVSPPLASVHQLGIGNAHSFQPPLPQPRQWSSASTFAPASSSCQPFRFGDKPEPEEEDIPEPSPRPCKKTKTEFSTYAGSSFLYGLY